MEIVVPRSEQRESVAREFAYHPAFQIAIVTARELGNRLELADPPPAVIHLHNQIEQTPPGKVQGATAALLTGMIKHDKPGWTLVRNLLALVCLRASLRVLNQLIYQRVRDEKLAFIDSKNLANMTELPDPLTGQVYEAAIQPQRDTEDRVQLGDLVLAELPNQRQLCRVEHMSSEVGPTGYDILLQLRPVGETLNPYENLLAQL